MTLEALTQAGLRAPYHPTRPSWSPLPIYRTDTQRSGGLHPDSRFRWFCWLLLGMPCICYEVLPGAGFQLSNSGLGVRAGMHSFSKCLGLRGFAFSPRVMAPTVGWQEEGGAPPAGQVVMEVPHRDRSCVGALFQVPQAKSLFNPGGECLTSSQ